MGLSLNQCLDVTWYGSPTHSLMIRCMAVGSVLLVLATIAILACSGMMPRTDPNRIDPAACGCYWISGLMMNVSSLV